MIYQHASEKPLKFAGLPNHVYISINNKIIKEVYFLKYLCHMSRCWKGGRSYIARRVMGQELVEQENNHREV